MSKLDPLKNLSPLFPWFGGKRRVASVIWQGLGSNVDLYVEPFAGAAAVFLARPFMRQSGYEVINDADGFVVNAYRAVRSDPETVLRYVDDLRSELEMLSRHRWLRGLREDLWARLMEDPEFYDAKVAGMWIFGQCNAIGAAWNEYKIGLGNSGRLNNVVRGVATHNLEMTLIDESRRGIQPNSNVRGVASNIHEKGALRPYFSHDRGDSTIMRSRNGMMPLDHSRGDTATMQNIDGGTHPTINSNGASFLDKNRGIQPTIHDAGDTCIVSKIKEDEGMMRPYATNRMGLSCDPNSNLLGAYVKRLAKTIILCGDFERSLADSYSNLVETVGVFLDPPYEGFDYYGAESGKESPSKRAREWAIAKGGDPKFRIVLAGYEGEHEMPSGWSCFAWTTPGGFANQKAGKANENAARERLWFSPGCGRVEGAKKL